MRLHILNPLRVNPSFAQCLPQHRLLRYFIGYANPGRSSILIDRRGSDDGIDRVALIEGTQQWLHNHDATAFGPHITVGSRVKALEAAVRSYHRRFAKSDSDFRAQYEIYASNKRKLAFTVPDTLAGEMSSHQRG